MNKNNKPLNIEKVLFVNIIEPMANERIDENVISQLFFPTPNKNHSITNRPTELEIQANLTQLVKNINFYRSTSYKGKQVLYFHKSSNTDPTKWLSKYFPVHSKSLLKRAFDEIIKRLILSVLYADSIQKGINFNENFPFTEIRQIYSPQRKDSIEKLSNLLPKSNYEQRVDLNAYKYIYQLTKNIEYQYWIKTVKNS